MKQFLLIFEDLMELNVLPAGRTSKPAARKALAESKESLIARMGLVERKLAPTQFYWDGKVGDVVISIYEIPVEEILSQDELNRLVHKLHGDWY